jgi:hypothetical protein
MKISYAITVCNELVEIQKLVPYLRKHIRKEDEIVILFDKKNGDRKIEEFLRGNSVNDKLNWSGKNFNGNFSQWKNKLNKMCKGDYIFQIDADEIPNEILIQNLHTILETNPDVEVYHVPRVNTVEGLTDEHIKKWRWRVDDKGWVNWPDYQMRVYKNKPEIQWRNKVHEVIEGHTQFSAFPPQEELALYHPKDIKRQEKQNEYYDTL